MNLFERKGTSSLSWISPDLTKLPITRHIPDGNDNKKATSL